MRSLAALLFASSFFALASPASADAPRIAVVVEGDAVESTTAAAQRLDAALAASTEATLPSDELVRAALRGASGTPDDGLDPVRGLRRRLGWSNDADREALAAIAEQLELVAIVVVHGADAPVARVYDAAQAHYFVGEAPLDEASVETSTRFVLARVRAAERRRVAPLPEATATAEATPSEVPTTEPDATTDAPPRRSFMRRNWPFFVAGALLVGATTFFVVQRNGGDSSPPVIHVRPGGSP